RPAELVLELLLRLRQLAGQLVVAEPSQVGVGDAVRAEEDAALAVRAQIVPGHRRELARIVARELGDCQRSPFACVAGADEDLDRNAEALERRKDRGR